MTGVVLHWIPLGAGASVVRHSGAVYEALAARLGRRPPLDLYHSALEVMPPGARVVIEMTPVPDASGDQRGVVGEGAVGTAWAGRLRIFRYEIRCWRDGVIPDVGHAAGAPTTVCDDPVTALRILDLATEVPTPIWGRDELGAGEMWNSNSVTSWLLASAGVDLDAIRPPAGGRAPGWNAGLVVAGRAESEPPCTTSAPYLRSRSRSDKFRPPAPC